MAKKLGGEKKVSQKQFEASCHIISEQSKAARRTRIEDAACALQTNAVDTAKEVNRNWREMTETEWQNAIYEQKVLQLGMFADQYRIDVDELRTELGLL